MPLPGDVELRHADHNLPTPRSSPASRTLLPPFGAPLGSHLPTPQSPSNTNIFNGSLSYSQESPSRHPFQSHRSLLADIQHTTPLEPPSPATGSILTPEASPFFLRKAKSSQQSSPSSPPHTPRASSRSDFVLASSPPVQENLRSPIPPPISREISPPLSGLSSPFVDRRPLSNGHTGSRSNTPRRSRLSMDIDDDMFSAGPSTSTLSTPLPAPVPQRPVGGEMHRIRLQAAADQAARQHETEARRPDYLIRSHRPSLEFDFDNFEMPEPPIDSANPNLGVTESPVKGRRIALFQETSEESFEQSLLAGGYPRYGNTPAYSEPQTPVDSKGKSILSQKAMDWLSQSTPAGPGVASSSTEIETDWVPSEKEIKKRKRMVAFEEATTPSRPLYPLVVEGHGRLLYNVPLEGIPLGEPEAPPAKKRGKIGRKKGKASANLATPKKNSQASSEPAHEDAAVPRPNWPDEQFPWSMRAQERAQTSQREHAEKMRIIERYFDRNSDEDSDDEDQTLGPPVHTEDPDEELPIRRGRGKWAGLKENPNDPEVKNPSRIFLPCDPGDARAALISKRSIRKWRYARMQRRQKEKEEEIVCICHGKDDGRELVQCDECRTWYHLRCIGIRNVSDLGNEDDPWYCERCLDLPIPSSDPAAEPTFVPTDERPSRSASRDNLFFPSSLQASPTGPLVPPQAPKTPTRARDRTESTFPSRSSFADSSRGPTTPMSSAHSPHIYQTPTIFDDPNTDESPFDPTSTPSRGIKIGWPYATPKGQSIFTARSGQMRTPSRPPRHLRKYSGDPPLGVDESGGPSPYRPTTFAYDDTPVRRSRPAREERSLPMQRRLWDTPQDIRSIGGGLQESPIMRTARLRAESRRG